MSGLVVHHLNCASFCPVGGGLLDGLGAPLRRTTLVCHCLLVETSAGLVLVDTGLGTADLASARSRLGAGFVTLLSPRLDPAETALAQVRARGYSPDDVRHIALTHMDLDHAGGLPDFPRAKVHVHRPEHIAATGPLSLKDRGRYKPVQWAHGADFALYEPRGEPWFGFECVRELSGLPPELLLVPLVGHSMGHSGVAVQSPSGWQLLAGDAYFFHGELEDPPHCPPALGFFQNAVQVNGPLRLHNQARLRELAKAHGGEVRIFSAHDPIELERMRAVPPSAPERRNTC